MPVETVTTVNAREKDVLSIHWSAIFAGVFIAMLTDFILMSLGTALGAATTKAVIQGETSAQSLGTGAGLWTLVSVLISLFVGSYASSRVSGIIATRIGYTQGAVISAMFFTLLFSGLGIGLGILGLGLGSATGKVMGAAADVATSPTATRITEDALSDLNIDRPQEITAGVVSRVMAGDTDSAATFLSNRVHIPLDQAQTHLENLRAKITDSMTQAAQKSADAAQVVGWSVFATMLLGAVSALFGGAVGAQINIKRPFSKMDRRALAAEPAYT